MDTNYKITTAIAVFALIVSFISLSVSFNQYRLNEARDKREREAELPSIELFIGGAQRAHKWEVNFKFVSRSRVTAKITGIEVRSPEKAVIGPLAQPFAGFQKLDTIVVLAPNESAEVRTYLVIDDNAPGGIGKTAEFVIFVELQDNSGETKTITLKRILA